MRETELKLVDDRLPARERPPALAALLPLLLLLVAAWASYRGADRWLHPLDAREHVRATVELALNRGSAAPEVREALRQLRRELGQRPLDSSRRVQYAALLLSLTREMEDTQAAVWHARSAAALAPVTLPVVRLAALVLARSGDADGALDLARSVFAFDADGASQLLLLLEETIPTERLHLALPDRPDAWAAWAQTLTEQRRDEEADRWLARAGERWPGHLGLRVTQARRAAQWERWDRLGELVEPPLEQNWQESQEGRRWAGLRALWLAQAGRADEAGSLLDEIQRGAPLNPPLLTTIGDAQLKLGAFDEARRAWSRALFSIDPSRPQSRITLHVRLATLAESRGEAALALRHWRSILKLDPQHPLALRQIETLTGRTSSLMLTSDPGRRVG